MTHECSREHTLCIRCEGGIPGTGGVGDTLRLTYWFLPSACECEGMRARHVARISINDVVWHIVCPGTLTLGGNACLARAQTRTCAAKGNRGVPNPAKSQVRYYLQVCLLC